MGYSLGISAYFHESSVSLFLDGNLIGFSREEYFSRVKGDKSFPRLAIQFYKKKYNLDSKNIDFACFYEKPLRGFLTIMVEAFKNLPEAKELIFNNISNIKNSGLFFAYDMAKNLPISRDKIIYCPHHLSHVLSALPFMEKQVPHTAIVIDGVGDSACTSVYEVNKGIIKLIKKIQYPQSLGLMYSAITDYLGFNINDGEYKVMALAAYGNSTCEQKFRELVDDGCGELNIEAFQFYRSLRSSYSEEFVKVFGPRYDKLTTYPAIGSSEFCRAADVAFAAQRYLENSVCEIFREVHERTGHGHFTFSGGVALNSKLVSKLTEQDYIDFLFVPPNPGDSGAAIGAGVFATLKSGNEMQINKTPFLGPKPDDLDNPDVKDIFLTKCALKTDLWGDVAKLISEGEIIALVDGPAEVGPRALGHRSLLCDPRNLGAVKKLSQEVKGREEFRPLAPACLDLYVDDWFLVSEKVRASLKWMGSVVYPTDRCLRELVSVLHVDNTARLQIVDNRNLSFYQLLTKFYEFTNCPILINTSFNSGGDPIVLDVQDTISTSIRMGVEYVVLGKTLYKTKKQ